MSRMFDLTEVLKLPNDRVDHSPLSQNDFIYHMHQLILHLGSKFSDQLDALLKKLFK